MNIEETKQRMSEVLQETIDYYDSPEKFGYNKETAHCVYLDEDTGAMCAFGRCVMNPESLPQEEVPVEDIFDSNEDIDEVMKEEYRGLPLEFWQYLQRLHDYSSVYLSITDAMNKSDYIKLIRKTIADVIEEYGSEAP